MKKVRAVRFTEEEMKRIEAVREASSGQQGLGLKPSQHACMRGMLLEGLRTWETALGVSRGSYGP